MKTEISEPRENHKNREKELSQENARLRGDLLTMAHRISHDLRTPLGGLSMTGEMLKEMANEGSPISAALVNPIFDSTEEILKLIERVSFLLKASVKPAAMGPVKMGETVFETLEKLERNIIKNKASITQPNDWPEVMGVQAWLRVVWYELVSNALKNAKHPLKIKLGWNEDNDGYCFWVSDDAGGVPVEKRKELFQPFETLSQPDSAHGLGLSIVQRLVRLQNGRCGYEPIADNGSMFYFILPAGDE